MKYARPRTLLPGAIVLVAAAGVVWLALADGGAAKAGRVTKDSVPQATIEALKRRSGMARIYLFGGPKQISPAVAKQFAECGTIIRVTNDDWQAAVASAPLSHLGFHAPLLFTDNASKLPAAVDGYLRSVAPTYLTSPADGPYNMTYVIGSWSEITWPLQAHVDYISEMANRRLWNQNTGGRYSDSAP